VVVDEREVGLRLLIREMRRLQAPAVTVIEEYLPERLDHPVYE